MQAVAKAIHAVVNDQTDNPVEILIQDSKKFLSCVSYAGELKEFKYIMSGYTERAIDYIYTLGYTKAKCIYVGIA